MTFSISGRCSRTGKFGIAVASSSPAVAARCAHARAGPGVVGRSGPAAGGKAGPVHSAGVVVVRGQPWPIAGLRVDWNEANPVAALAALWARWQPEQEAYLQRSLDPTVAPSYGVPGDP